MRFRWVPAVSDSVLPFFIGILEFMLVETLGPDHIGLWFFLLAAVFALMHWVTHHTMKRARQDPANAGFFGVRKPAVLSDFRIETASVSGLTLAGLIIVVTGNNSAVTLVLLLGASGLLGWSFYQSSRFWAYSIAEDIEE
jgi:hypothetical protein